MKPFDEQGAFRAATDLGGLRRVAVRGAGVTALFQSLGFAIQMIATVILARLLTPADFGLVAIVTTFSLLLMNVGFNGITEAVVQREQIDHGLASNLFWITRRASASCSRSRSRRRGRCSRASMVIRGSAPWRSPCPRRSSSRAPRSCIWPSSSGPCGSRACPANDLVARATSVIVSIALGWAAWGYWALVAGAIALPLTTCIGAWIRCRWMPGAPRRSGRHRTRWFGSR